MARTRTPALPKDAPETKPEDEAAVEETTAETTPAEPDAPEDDDTVAGTRYVFAGSHVGDLADGRTVEPGQIVTLDSSAIAAPHNASLIDAGTLLLVETDPTKED